MTTSLAKRGVGGRETYWTPQRVIESIQRWVAVYGEPPRSADWNPSAAKWSASTWRIERYKAGDPETGAPWPSLNAAKKAFDGSLSAAIVAAGFAPNKPGPKNRKDVRPEVVETQMTPEVRVALDAARAEARDLRSKVAVRDRQLAEAREARVRLLEQVEAARRAAGGRERRARTRTVTKTKTRTVTDRKAVREAEKAARAASKVEISRLRLELASARRDSTRDASKLERAEATINTLRGDRRDLKRELERAEDRVAGMEKRLARMSVPPAPEVKKIVKVEREVVELPAPEAAVVEEGHRLTAEAEKKMAEADMRIAVAERKYRELAEAATGEARMLTAAEMAALRKGGPSGSTVLAQALASLAKARKKGGREPLKGALWEIASAAVRWRDRL